MEKEVVQFAKGEIKLDRLVIDCVVVIKAIIT